ncbi:hypothetical protein SAMN05216390_11374 [Lachnospiraceae bacterium KH1T2]|nr:hypothetical protein SAMN05216390_11374 [Lachnospiraceae bacterium KH1T2]
MSNTVIIDNEDYIPMKIRINDDGEILKFYFYEKGTKSLLEFALGEYSGELKRITLLLSEEYYFINDYLSIYSKDEVHTKLKFNRKECKTFKTFVYNNGVKIQLSGVGVENYIRIENIYLGISKSKELLEIRIVNMNENELKHICNELKHQ